MRGDAWQMEIVYLRDWPTNIGNTFIHLGSLQCLKNALPEAKIHVLGGLGRRLLHASATSRYQKAYQYYVHLVARASIFKDAQRSISEKHYQKIFWQTERNIENFYDMSLGLQADFIVVSGCILTNQLGLFAKTLKEHKRKKRKIIFLSVGGDNYSQSEVETVRSFLEKLEPYVFISRDHEAYKNYYDTAVYSYNGIDAAFFVNDCFSPPTLKLPEYIILCFDKQKEPKIITGGDLVIRTTHYVYPSVAGRIVKKIYKKENLLLSDNPEDYLTLYANAKEVHTDRIHACCASLAFGTPCKLYGKSKRSLLLDRLNLYTVSKELSKLDSKVLEKEKMKQVNFLKQVLT